MFRAQPLRCTWPTCPAPVTNVNMIAVVRQRSTADRTMNTNGLRDLHCLCLHPLSGMPEENLN